MGNFDGLLIIKSQLDYGYHFKLVKRETRILKIEIIKDKMSINLLDSLNILPGYQDQLGKEFKINKNKGDFPYLFVNENNLNYIGLTPDKKYFKNDPEIISDWNLKNETFKYLKDDIHILYDILNKFGYYIGKTSSIDISKHLTIASLAYKTYFSSYYNEKDDLKVIKKGLESKIRQSYYGGHTEVYKHYGKNLYYYDVNSQYPYAMLKDMPTGNPIYINSKNINDYFGFIYAEIEIKNIKNPLLPKRGENNKQIYPKSGKWIGIYFSEELKSVSKYGYKIKPLYGWTFERNNNLFKNYVEKFYNDKLNAKIENNPVKSKVAKLFLNSLYGKFGMNEVENKCIIDSPDKIKDIIKKYPFSEIEELNENNIWSLSDRSTRIQKNGQCGHIICYFILCQNSIT